MAEHNHDNEEAGQLMTMTRMALTEMTQAADNNNNEGMQDLAGGQGTDHNKGGRARGLPPEKSETSTLIEPLDQDILGSWADLQGPCLY